MIRRRWEILGAAVLTLMGIAMIWSLMTDHRSPIETGIGVAIICWCIALPVAYWWVYSRGR